MVFLELKAILWQNRRRRWYMVFIVIKLVLPGLVFLLASYLTTESHKITVHNSTYHKIIPISYSLRVKDVEIVYAPNNSYYQNIMHKTIKKFQLQNDSLIGFSSEKSLMQYLSDHPSNTIDAVIFKGTNEQHLDYYMNYHDGFLNTPYSLEKVTAMQKAISMSFIEVNLGKDIEDNFKVFLKKFPYPPHKNVKDTRFFEYLPCLTLFTFIYMCVAIPYRVVKEKQMGAKELLKMNGKQPLMLWLAWFILEMAQALVTVTFILISLKLAGAEHHLIKYTDGRVLFCYLLLYYITTITFCFAISSYFNNTSLAMVSCVLIWVSSFYISKCLFELYETYKYPWYIKIIGNLLPNMALHYGYSIMVSYEEREIGVEWSNIRKSSSGSSEDITLLNVFLMLLINMVIYILITLFLGSDNVKDSLLLIWMKFKTIFTRKTSSNNVEANDPLLQSEKMNHRKKYGKRRVIENLNLNIYEHKITVLFGDRGAGKSTVISMISGMLEPTSGSILIKNMDLKTNKDKIRSIMGFCPQHNYLFPDLTVKEHVVFFAMLKGLSTSKASEEADKLLEEWKIDKEANEMAHTLSEDMKRKLSLSIATIGDPPILVLDEPSSGMDTTCRRELWNILLKWRETKTILISTHCIEEADTLGNWIAILSNGRLQCYEAAMHLKRGYHLSLMVADHANDQDIRTFVKEQMPHSSFESQTEKKIIFRLAYESRQVDNFMSQLEQEKERLRIENFSLEDRFLKVMDDKDITESSVNNGEVSNGENIQIKSLCYNRRSFFCRKKNFIIVLIFIVLVLMICCHIFIHNDSRINLDAYKNTLVYVSSSNDVNTTKYKNVYKQLINNTLSSVLDVENVEHELLQTAKDNIILYKENIIISSIFTNSSNGTDIYALYNSFALHSPLISLNIVTNTVAKALLGDNFSITLSNWPEEKPKFEFLRVDLSIRRGKNYYN